MKMVIGGNKVDSSNGEVIEVYNPTSHEFIDTVPSATEDDVNRAIEIAQEGKRLWAETPLYKREEVLLKFADLMEKNKEELANLSSQEMGKPLAQSEEEVDIVVRLFRGYVEKIKHMYGKTLPESSQPGIENDMSFTRREPLGVVVCLIPFNFPLELYAQKAAPALAAGNAIIAKPASDTPLGAIRMTELMIEAGIPGSVAQIVTGRGSSVGRSLSTSPDINAVSLTGSTEVGIQLSKYASDHLHRVFLELGGNDALVVFDDADIDHAVEEAVFGRTFNSGQVCCATKRFVIQNSIVGEFTNKLVERLKQIKIGDPLASDSDMGPLVSEMAAENVERQVNLTIEQGAKCLYGGKRFNKTYFEPTVLVDVTPDMDIAKNMEVFGPIFPIIGFETLDEAVEIVNASQYGLMGGVITNDINKAMKIATRMESGGVVINGCSVYRTSDMPFGGYKKSGMGREGISHTLEEMTQEKTIVMKGVLK